MMKQFNLKNHKRPMAMKTFSTRHQQIALNSTTSINLQDHTCSYYCSTAHSAEKL